MAPPKSQPVPSSPPGGQRIEICQQPGSHGCSHHAQIEGRLCDDLHFDSHLAIVGRCNEHLAGQQPVLVQVIGNQLQCALAGDRRRLIALRNHEHSDGARNGRLDIRTSIR